MARKAQTGTSCDATFLIRSDLTRMSANLNGLGTDKIFGRAGRARRQSKRDFNLLHQQHTRSTTALSSTPASSCLSMLSMKSPVPAPDQSVFDSHVLSSKKKTPGNRPQCPSPPLKTPPVSRIFNDQPLITPTAKIIQTPGTFVSSPDRLGIRSKC